MVARDRKVYNPDEFKANALALEKLAAQPWGYFTPDSNYQPTRASAAVWTNAAEFKQVQDAFLAKTGQLVKAADGGNLEIIRTAVNDVQSTCKTCHDQFRKSY